MGLRVRRVKRAFGFDKTKTEKYVIVPDRATIVSFEHLCEQVALISGINLGMVQATIFGLVRSMRTFIQQGHTVQVDGFGTFIPSFNAKSSLVEKEANICKTSFPPQRGVEGGDELDGIRIRRDGQYERF